MTHRSDSDTNNPKSSILDQVFTQSPSFMSLTLGPEHVFERANQRYLEILHLDSSILGERVQDVFPEITSQGFIKLLDQVYQSGQPYFANEAPLRLRTKDGQERLLYVSFAYQPIRDSDGKIYGVIHQGYEVTETVLARRALENSKNAIENERENFRNLFRQTPEMVCILSGPEHVFEFVNEAHIKALGFDATGMAVRKAQPESIEVHGILDEVYRTGKTAFLHEIPVTLTDRLRYFNLTYAARRNNAGEVDGVMILGIEITDQVLAREDLRSSREKLHQATAELEHKVSERTRELKDSRTFLDSVIENIPNMLFVKRAKDLRFVRFNKAGSELLGVPQSQLIGKNDYDFFPKEESDQFVAKDREVLSAGKVVDIPEETIQTSSLGQRILHTRKIPIFGTDGTPEYLLGISEDITERKKAEEDRLRFVREQTSLEERRLENQRVTFLAEASTILASSLNYHETLDALTRLVTQGLADWCTVTLIKQDGSGERIAIAHKDPDKAPLLDELLKNYPANPKENAGIGAVIRTGKTLFTPHVVDEMLVAAARDERHLEIIRSLGCHSCIVVPIVVRSKTFGAIAFMSSRPERIFNETDLAMTEELGRRTGISIDNAFLYETAQTAIRSRDEFMSIASHELKTPLTSLKLQSELRLRDVNQGQFRRFEPATLPRLIAEDQRQINRLTRLVDDMLDISRIDSGKLTFSEEEVSLCELVTETIDRLAPQIEAQGCQVRFTAHCPAIGIWDRFRLEQVLVNLITNAMKYGSGKSVEIEAGIQDDRAFVSVTDHGIGISETDQSRIFDRFERAVSSTSISGLGLGLYISKRIIEAHRGEITVTSRVGQGSTFTVILPLPSSVLDQPGLRAEHSPATRQAKLQ